MQGVIRTYDPLTGEGEIAAGNDDDSVLSGVVHENECEAAVATADDLYGGGVDALAVDHADQPLGAEALRCSGIRAKRTRASMAVLALPKRYAACSSAPTRRCSDAR